MGERKQEASASFPAVIRVGHGPSRGYVTPDFSGTDLLPPSLLSEVEPAQMVSGAPHVAVPRQGGADVEGYK